MALPPVPPQAVSLAVSFVPRTELDHHPPTAKVSTSLNAHAVVKQYTLGKQYDQFAKDVRNITLAKNKAIIVSYDNLKYFAIDANYAFVKI